MYTSSVDLDRIADLMIANREKGRFHMYLDTRTGQAEVVSEDLLNAVLSKDANLLAELPEQEREAKVVAEFILADQEGRFAPLPEIEAVTELQWMTDFTEMVGPTDLYEELKSALDVRPLMNRFRALMAEHPTERQLWLFHRAQRKKQEAEALLNELTNS